MNTSSFGLCGHWVRGWEAAFLAVSFKFGVGRRVPYTIRFAHAKELKARVRKSREFYIFKAPLGKEKNTGGGGGEEERKKGIKSNFAGNFNKSGNKRQKIDSEGWVWSGWNAR